MSQILDMPCAWKELSKLVKTARQDSIGGVNGFFDAVTMMNVNVNVQDTLMLFEQL